MNEKTPMKKVLIVDDDELLAVTWNTVFKAAGFSVIIATNGTDALNLAGVQKPDCIILDQMLPDMMGNAVLDALKQQSTTHHIAVLVVSNFNEPTVMLEAIHKGALDYLLKYQIQPQDLVERVTTILEKSVK